MHYFQISFYKLFLHFVETSMIFPTFGSAQL